MNKRAIATVFGIIGLALLLAGCGGLFRSPEPSDGVALVPGNPEGIVGFDPRLLGESLIEGEYIPDRLVVGISDDANGRSALDEVVRLVGERAALQVDLGEVVLVLIDLKNHLDVPEALGLVSLLARGKLGSEVIAPVSKGNKVEIRVPLKGGQPLKGLLFAEPDYDIPKPEVRRSGELDVLSLGPTQYSYDNDLTPYQWALPAVNAAAAWSLATGQGVIVAVMDTGIDSTHPDLAGQVIRRFNCRTGLEADPAINFDTDNHGTHCAGIIAAKNDGKGIVGLAYNVKLFDVRIFDPGWIGTVQYARGVKWAVDNGAKVLSNSWGGAAYSHAIKAAVDYALVNGAIHVNSAGNDWIPYWRRPASIPGVISVAAIDAHLKAASFTTPGTTVSVGAPGVRVLSTVRSQTIQAGTGVPLRYDYYDGTSMACPYVSALAAMILERNPGATPYQVKKLLEATARDIEAVGFDTLTGHGFIQADRALTTALPANDGAALRVHVVTASSQALWGNWWPVPYMDITLRRGGRIIAQGQTDWEGRVNLGFPTGDYPGVYNPGEGLGYFPVLEPGTYEVTVAGEDCRLFAMRTANRVTGQRVTVTLTPGGVETLTIPVNTTLEVTLSWSGGGPDTDIDLAVGEPYIGPGGATAWTFAWAPGLWGTWTPDRMGESGTETYTLNPVHGDDAFYPLAVVWWAGTRPTSVTVTVRQNTVVETYTLTLTTTGWYPAYSAGPPVTRWTNWWNNYSGPYVY